jgi:hypothetical protein
MSSTRCEEFERMLVERADVPAAGGGASPGVLDPGALAAHLEACGSCRAFEVALRAVPGEARAALSAADPGDAFFVAKRNEIWQTWQSSRRAEPVGVWARVRRGWADATSWMFLQRRGLAAVTVGAVAAAVLAIALWPRSVSTPRDGDAPIVDIGANGMAQNGDSAVAEREVLSELGTLSRDEMQMLSTRLTIETSADLSAADPEDDPEGMEGQIDALTPEELKALDLQLAIAQREGKGA